MVDAVYTGIVTPRCHVDVQHLKFSIEVKSKIGEVAERDSNLSKIVLRSVLQQKIIQFIELVHSDVSIFLLSLSSSLS